MLNSNYIKKVVRKLLKCGLESSSRWYFGIRIVVEQVRKLVYYG